MKHELVEAIGGAIFAIALIMVEEILPFGRPINILIAGSLGAVGFTLCAWIYLKIKYSKSIRKRQDDLYSFQGEWLEEWTKDGKAHYSIFVIDFDEKSKTYVLVGNAYDENGNWFARWTSHCIFYDRTANRVIYISDGNQLEGKVVFGASCIFVDLPAGNHARGFFIDDSSGVLARFDFELIRLIDGQSERQANCNEWVRRHHKTRKHQRRA